MKANLKEVYKDYFGKPCLVCSKPLRLVKAPMVLPTGEKKVVLLPGCRNNKKHEKILSKSEQLRIFGISSPKCKMTRKQCYEIANNPYKYLKPHKEDKDGDMHR